MAGLKFTTDADTATLLKLAYRRAQEMGFAVSETGNMSLRIRRGNLLLGIIMNPVVAYCDFKLSVEEYDDANEVVLEWESPWWIGVVGVARTKNQAKELMKNLRDEVSLRGSRIFDEKEF
jgi:hypothetical protein